MSLQKNKIYRGIIEGYSSEGLGIARIEGQVIFVHRGIRGEECDILVMKVLKNVAFGKVVKILTPSEHRVEPDCPWFGKCGGCDFRHMDYEEELISKKQRVQDALGRIGGSDVVVEAILGAGTCDRYRNKSIYPISAEGVVGLYRARTHDVQKVESCLLQKKEADLVAVVVQEYIEKFKISSYDEKTHKGLLRHLYVRTNEKGECLVCLIVNGDCLPKEEILVEMIIKAVPTVGVILCSNTRPGNAILGNKYRTLWGKEYISDKLCGLQFDLSVPSFYQVNHNQAERLYDKAIELAELSGNEVALDLYCGAGTITQVLSKHCKKVIGAEIVPEAIENAIISAKKNGIGNVEFFCGDAKDVAGEFAKHGLCPDIICVDPPRKGLAAEVIDAIVSMNPQKVIYVSCDPATLGRDTKLFETNQYRAKKAVAVDLFPRTANIESVVLLART